MGLSRAVIVPGLSRQDAHLLALAEDAGFSEVTPHSDALSRAIASLTLAGLVEDSSGGGNATLARPHVAVFGLGTIGIAAAIALAHEAAHLYLIDEDPASSEPRGTFSATGGGTCAGAALEVVRRVHPDADARVGPGDYSVAIVVSVGSPAMDVCVPLLSDEVPHVLVVADDEGITVGPVVIPGQGPCARCVGLHATERDTSWPVLAAQLARRRPRTGHTLAYLAGAWAADLALAAADGTAPLSVAWRISRGNSPQQMLIEPHPDCGCGAFETASGPGPWPALRRSGLSAVPSND